MADEPICSDSNGSSTSRRCARIRRSCPIFDTEGVIGGLWADREGYIDTTGTVQAYARAAKLRGADVIEHNKVEELIQRTDGSNLRTPTWALAATPVY